MIFNSIFGRVVFTPKEISPKTLTEIFQKVGAGIHGLI
jgi:hypothetical protein